MLDILNKGFITFIGKNRQTFLLLVLISANVYQYINGINEREKLMTENARINSVIQQNAKEELKHERERTERLEFLLNALTKKDSIP